MGILLDLSPLSESVNSLLSSPLPPINDSPVLLQPSPSARHARTREVEAAILDARETLQCIQSVFENIEKVMLSVALRRNQLEMALNPISALPSEILLAIFQCLMTSDDDNTWGMSLSISQVCSRWRSVSLSSSTLWSNLSVASSSQACSLIPLFAQRSRHTKCSVKFKWSLPKSRNGKTEIPWPLDAVEILPHTAAQISQITFSHPMIAHSIIMGAEAASMISLETITVFEGSDTSELRILPYLHRTKQAHLYAVDARLWMATSFNLLESLILSSISEISLTNMLNHCTMPLLKHLVLRRMTTPRATRDGEPIVLHTLESLIFHKCHPLATDIIDSVIMTPNLSAMSVEYETMSGPLLVQAALGQQTIRTVLHRISPQLQSFSLALIDPESVVSSISSNAGSSSAIPIYLENLRLEVPAIRSLQHRDAEFDAVAAGHLRSLLEPRLLSSKRGNSFDALETMGGPLRTISSLSLSSRLVGEYGDWYAGRVKHFRITDSGVL